MEAIFSPSPRAALRRNPIFFHSTSPPPVLSFPLFSYSQRSCALKTGSDGGRIGCSTSSSGTGRDVYRSDFLRKLVVSTKADDEERVEYGDEDQGKVRGEEGGNEVDEEEWVDWEDQILEDTVPLVGFVRTILHSGKYESGERLSSEHEKAILEKLLPYHPEYEKKIGSGVDYITVGYHPDFESSRCLFIVRRDGEQVDFSYWKCIKGLIRQNYPLYADSFILRHFRKHRRN